jgi:hypothetical protein
MIEAADSSNIRNGSVRGFQIVRTHPQTIGIQKRKGRLTGLLPEDGAALADADLSGICNIMQGNAFPVMLSGNAL